MRKTVIITKPEEIVDTTSVVYKKGNMIFYKDVLNVWAVLGRTSVVFSTKKELIKFLF